MISFVFPSWIINEFHKLFPMFWGKRAWIFLQLSIDLSRGIVSHDNISFLTPTLRPRIPIHDVCAPAIALMEDQLGFGTRVKISHLVTSLPTDRQQVFTLLVPNCQQVWNKLLTTHNNLVDIIRLVARLFQQVRYSHDITILLQPCTVNLVNFLLCHDCIRAVRTTLLQVW
jgi:hypothetical protein